MSDVASRAPVNYAGDGHPFRARADRPSGLRTFVRDDGQTSEMVTRTAATVRAVAAQVEADLL